LRGSKSGSFDIDNPATMAFIDRARWRLETLQARLSSTLVSPQEWEARGLARGQISCTNCRK
jgi:hypothetical protein